MTTSEKVAYLKGVAAGIGLGKEIIDCKPKKEKKDKKDKKQNLAPAEAREDRLLKAIIDTLECVSTDLSSLDERLTELTSDVDAISDDLVLVEKTVFDEEFKRSGNFEDSEDYEDEGSACSSPCACPHALKDTEPEWADEYDFSDFRVQPPEDNYDTEAVNMPSLEVEPAPYAAPKVIQEPEVDEPPQRQESKAYEEPEIIQNSEPYEEQKKTAASDLASPASPLSTKETPTATDDNSCEAIPEDSPQIAHEPSLEAKIEVESEVEVDAELELVYYDVACPVCEKLMTVKEDILLKGKIQCPHCSEMLELDTDDDDDDFFDDEGKEHEEKKSKKKKDHD